MNRPALIRNVAGGLFAAFALAAAVIMVLRATEPAAAIASVKLPETRPAALVQATSGTALMQLQAVGDRARVINAAMPFTDAPIEPARSFVLSGDSMEKQRALLCLTQAVYYEAGFEPLQGRRAVAQVVLNRVRHPAFPKSVCGVVYEGAGTGTCQFTFVCDGALYRRPAPDAWREAEIVARAALGGYVERSVGEATHYHADYVAPRWAPFLAKVAVIGQHIFYRWPGAWGHQAAFSGRYIGEPRDPLAMRPPVPVNGTDADGTSVQMAQADVGPPVPRAPNDVGGLLDTSKGWTLHIPGPDEIDGEAAKRISAQQGSSSLRREVATASPLGVPIGSK